MAKSQFNSVIVTGGLGNQLFQIIGAVTNFPEIRKGLYLNSKSNSNPLPTVLDFNLNLTSFELERIEPNYYAQRLFNLSIRISSRKKNKLLHNLLNGAVNILFKFTNFDSQCLIQNGIGYSKNEKISKKPNCHIGYFQGFGGLSNLQARKILSSLTLKNDDKEVVAHAEGLSEKEHPLVVHYRLGDYLIEDRFGIPGSDYYELSIGNLWKTNKYKKIWVFSNDINKAKKIFPSAYLQFVRWFDDPSTSPAETLEQMRFGHAYIISNSTFAWWGAYLSKTPEATVVAPSKWFKAKDDPIQMIPKNWLTSSANYAE